MDHLLTISIPTFNRDKLFFKCLLSIKKSIENLDYRDQKLISIFISDNSDNDNTKFVANSDLFEDLNIIYVKNHENIGSDKNISNCYTVPVSKYVMILGDDDFLEINSLKNILVFLKTDKYDLLFLKAYGLTNFNDSKRVEKSFNNISFNNVKEILFHRNIHLAFISSTIFKKGNVTSQEISNAVGTSLVQLHFVFLLLSRNAKAIFINSNLVSVTRNNTGGYDPFNIFITNYFSALKKYENLSLTNIELYNFKKKILNTFYVRSFSQYLKKCKLQINKNQLNLLDENFNSYFLYKYIYRNCFINLTVFNFFILTFFFISFNIIYYPTRIFDFLYHIKNIIKRTLIN